MGLKKKVIYSSLAMLFGLTTIASATSRHYQPENCDPIAPPPPSTSVSEPSAILAAMGLASGVIFLRRRKE